MRIASRLGLLVLVALLPAASALAQDAYDPVTVTPIRAGHGKVVLRLEAGPSGAPNGFALWWMKSVEFQGTYGGAWPASTGKDWGRFEGAPTLNTDDGAFSSFALAPGQVIEVEIGDLFDETGVAAMSRSELAQGESYVFTGFVLGDLARPSSALSATTTASTTSSTNCTYTIGYWRTHPEAWPVSSLTLGTVSYTKSQLLDILGEPARGNGLVSMAHQLIAAKLNIAAGADPSAISSTIAAADAQIGSRIVPPIGGGFLSPGSTSGKTQALDDWNNGITGPGHCMSTAPRGSTWGELKQRYH